MITVDKLSKHFIDPKRGVVKAVDGITFTAQPGQVFGLLGCNGAGKTTTLRMLSTVIKPTAGLATVAGFDVLKDGEEVRKRIGFLSSTTALYGRLTAREVIRYFGELYEMPAPLLDERMNYVIERLDIGEFADGLCDKLSTGQKQRVSIARTILHDPPVVFFDEPTSGLDVVTSQTVLQFIEEAKNQGKTVIFSTHIMSEAERLCDQVAIIHDGQIVAAGTVDEVKAFTGQTNFERAFLSAVGELQPALQLS